MREQGVTEDMYTHVESHREHPEYSEAERAAIRYAELFCTDHLAIDDACMEDLRTHFTDAEVLDLTICIGNFLAFGRLTQVLKLDQQCELP